MEYTGLARTEGDRLTLTDLGRWFVHQHNGFSAAVDADLAGEFDGEVEPFQRAVDELIGQVRRLPAPPARPQSESGELARATQLVRHLLGLRELLRPGLRVGKDNRPTPSSADQIVDALGLLDEVAASPIEGFGGFELLGMLWDVIEELGWISYKSRQARLTRAASELDPDSNRQVADTAHTATHRLLNVIDAGWPSDDGGADAVLLRLYTEPAGQTVDGLNRWLDELAFPQFGGPTPDTLRKSLVFHLRRAGRLFGYAGLAALHDDRLELTALGRSYVVDHYGFPEEPEINLDELARLPADAFVKACVSEPERADEFALSWLRDREADAAARELLAFACTARGDEQTAALLAGASLGPPVADAYRTALDDPVLRPYGQLCLIKHGLTSTAEADAFLNEVWRSDLRVVIPLLESVADSHPDKAMRRSARRSLYKARTQAA
jgi:hypothetical protein